MNVKNRAAIGPKPVVLGPMLMLSREAAAGPEPNAAGKGITQVEAAVGLRIEAGTGPRAGAGPDRIRLLLCIGATVGPDKPKTGTLTRELR